MPQCGLRTIELGAFNGLTTLTRLFLQSNEVCEILPGTFENMINLEHVDLSDNSLEHLDIATFSGLVNLHFVSLEKNKQQYIHPDTFFRLSCLKYIILRSNFGLQVPTDHNFINSHSLTKLDISGCNVSSVSVETFAKFCALEWLDLSKNKLRTVDINILKTLPKLSELYLYYNPLQCDCQLKEVWRWCTDRYLQTDYVICDTPSEVEGMWWDVLEKGKCVDGNIQYYGFNKNKSYRYSYIDDTYSDTETDTFSDRETDMYNDTEMDTYNGTEMDTYSDTETDTYNDTETDTYSDTETDTYSDTETDMYSDTETDTYSDT